MASAWGLSWLKSWGNSWGRIDTAHAVIEKAKKRKARLKWRRLEERYETVAEKAVEAVAKQAKAGEIRTQSEARAKAIKLAKQQAELDGLAYTMAIKIVIFKLLLDVDRYLLSLRHQEEEALFLAWMEM